MVNQKISSLLFFLFIFTAINLTAQTLDIDADVRARFEYRHGYNNLFPDNAEPAAFVNQRTRLNIGYKAEKLQLFIAVQDVSTWGDTRQILAVDGNDSFSLFQAWAQLHLNENWSTKLGRQVISYDDERIFGGLDWAMQGRFHDAAILKYKKDSFMVDIGGAFSQEQPRNEGNTFNIQGFFTYKSMQYAYLKKTWEKSSASFLFLNTGFQDFTGDANDVANGVSYRQTAGTYFKLPIQNVNIAGSAYYQFGKANATTDLAAYQASLEGTYKTDKILYGLGLELLSGTDQDGDSKNKSFFPLYGTNHKFNGFMDYFYAGNHANNVGLNDVYAKAVLTTGEKSNLLIKGHYFVANADLTGDADKYLGTEIDLVYTQTLMPFVKLNVGYSHMFASESMSLVKGGRPNDNTNNWGWVRLIINPNLLKTDLSKLVN
ncbi:alginate export family protein [Gelidibacter salicanalis]|uniref:Alginate export family protein n=1 Tax=Gelidibacter salicanalis TaxID=291193 RepID=A0A934KN91_9FLAO|nr:alginate export family protein [Gelidibacter salicanalis]MBJ7880404.1 alginate export family protein [Gelidibacter salicanalis]